MSSQEPIENPPDEFLGTSDSNEVAGGEIVSPIVPTQVAKIRGWHRPLLGIILLLVIGFVLVMPIVSQIVEADVPSKTPFKLQPMPLAEAIELQAMKALSVLWILSLGGTIGSFLNVVAYRMPRGKSVVFSPSCCPKCGSKIRPTDNMPVIGWLRLEGKCRSCRNRISPQYPIVEAIVAGLFLLVFVVELTSGGSNLPVRTPNVYSGIVWILFELRWDLIQLCLYHCALLSLLVSWALVDLDRQRVTMLAVVVGIAIVIVPWCFLPHLIPAPAIWPSSYYKPEILSTLMASIIGGVVGTGLGTILSIAFKGRATYSVTDATVDTEASADNQLAVGANESEQVAIGDRPEAAQSTELPSFESESAKKLLNESQPMEHGGLESGEAGLIQPLQLDPLEHTSETHQNPVSGQRDETSQPVMDYHSVLTPANLISAVAFAGLALGWQAVLTTALITLGLRAICLPLNYHRFRLPLTVYFLAATILHHTAWRWLAAMIGPFISESSINSMGLVGLLTVFMALVLVNRVGLDPARASQ